MNTSELIKQFSDMYPIDILEKYRTTESTNIIKNELPYSITELCKINTQKFKVYGSAGNGNWAEIPWVAILDKDITDTTTKGYYIVILFDKETQNFYLCLSLGWTQFEDEYGIKEGRRQIRGLARHYAKLLHENKNLFNHGDINLHANNSLGKGYEIGSVLSKKYSVETVTNDSLREGILELIRVYSELKDIVGNSILNLDVDVDKYDDRIDEFKKKVARSTLKEINSASIQKLINETNNNPPEIKERLLRLIVRNKSNALWVKNQANYICSICGREPFIQKNGQPYAEADHINPLGNKGPDNIENMRCLCAQCHAIMTHGSENEIKKLMA